MSEMYFITFLLFGQSLFALNVEVSILLAVIAGMVD